MKEHFLDFWPIYTVIFILIFLILGVCIYEYTYPCVYGHHEQQWQTTWIVQGDGSMMPCGGYYMDVFVCDCRTIRDSIK